jgi:hypothetical protein
MIINKLKLSITIVFAGCLCFKAKAQTSGSTNPVQTAFPFMLIAPDARAGAMGDVGAATSPDANSASYNPSKFAFIDHLSGISASYVPWLRNTVSDMSLSYLSAYHKISNNYVIAGSLRYFSMGNVDLTGNDGSSIGNYKPNEFAMDFTLAKKFGETFSLATTARYIHSSSGNGVAFSNAQAANAFAADVSATIKNKTILFQKEAELSYGLNISNIGTKVSYSKDGPKYFLPTNLKLGAASAFKLDEKDEFTLALDLNKLLVPAGQQSVDAFGNTFYDTSNISVPSGIFKSFGNPGAFKEITYSLGAEYKYDQMFAIRAGYFYENPDNGNRQYFTAGAGFRYKQLDFDFAYLFASQQASPLANTLRFSIAYSFSQK